jgi:hypothetical protein
VSGEVSLSMLPQGPQPVADMPYVSRLKIRLREETQLRRQRERELAAARRDLAQLHQRLRRRKITA